jgi:hypothetical protein
MSRSEGNIILFAVARIALFVLFIGFAASTLVAQSDSPDPVFSTIPFDQWLSQGDQPHMRWNVRMSEPTLSAHQRLAEEIFVEVDGDELIKRRGKGHFLMLLQLTDEKGQSWQSHQEIDLEHLGEGMKANDALFSQMVFLLPGDYRVAIAISADATGEHSVIQRRLHVAPLKNDPLPGAWSDLPAVEIVAPSKPPDIWYLPSIEGKLRLTVATHEPVHVDLVVNLTPSEEFKGSTGVQNRNFEVLLPAAKVLSQVNWENATFSLAMLDLSRRRVIWDQDNLGELDWPKASAALAAVNPGIIDVKSLENQQYSAEFFLDEIRRRISSRRRMPRRRRVVIVLSSKVRFSSAQEVHPLVLNGPTDARVYYIRYEQPPRILVGPPVVGRRGQILDGSFAARRSYAAIDQLEPLLKPLDPKLFEVGTPEQFRKALAAILGEIAKL